VDSFVEGIMKKNPNHNVRATLLGIAAAALAAATITVASARVAPPEGTPPGGRDHVMTNPCAQVMNWPKRAIAFRATPPSERGLQCPIEEDFGPPANDL
jgi:hypothetical protein